MRRYRLPAVLLIDAAVVALCWNVTYLFRLGFERWISARPSYDGAVLLGIALAYALSSLAWRVPQGLWRFSGFGEVKRLTGACLVAGLASATVVMGMGLVQIPRAVLALHPVVSLMGLIVVRIAYRMLYEHARNRIAGSDGEIRRALVLGAGGAARRLLAGIHQQGWIVLGLFDDDPAKQGTRVAGVPVLGPLAAMAGSKLLASATHLIVAMPAASPAQRRRALDLAAEVGLPVLIVPTAQDLADGADLRLRAIEPEDLLGRPPVELDESGVDEILRGQTVLVTGAGGSIGSELCRQIAARAPARLVLAELSEFNLYTVEQELSTRFAAVELVPLVVDVRDFVQIQATMARWRPRLVFHAAACKHVPLMEEHNAAVALRTNMLGTHHVALAAAQAGAERFVLISTDKAVNPTNVMGASKRAAEMAVSALAEAWPQTRFMAVRFGNVLGSSGSVIPKFKEQIARGGPLTVTHPDIIRYFMTIPESARLVLQAAVVGQSGQVLVLDMGEPVRIVDLARQMIRLAGHAPQAIRIEFTGLRPGEKLYEELLADADDTLPTAVPRLRVARLATRSNGIAALLTWAGAASTADDDEVRDQIRTVVPEYRPAAPTR